MFDKIRSFVRGVMRRMFPAKNIKEALNLDTCVSDEMLDRMNLWRPCIEDMLRGVKKRLCLQGKKEEFVREFANVVLNEMEAKVSVESLDTIFKDAIRDLNENLQSGLALGSFVIKPLAALRWSMLLLIGLFL